MRASSTTEGLLARTPGSAKFFAPPALPPGGWRTSPDPESTENGVPSEVGNDTEPQTVNETLTKENP